MKSLLLVLALLSGFTFGHRDAPKGDEWQSPEQLSLNKELPHAWFFSFTDVESARMVLPENSSLWKSLPDSRPVDFFKADYDDSSWADIPVPSNWNIVGIGKDGS